MFTERPDEGAALPTALISSRVNVSNVKDN